jgi:hypothetical protein
MAASGVTPAQTQQANTVRLYGTTRLVNGVVAASLTMFIGLAAGVADHLFAGFMARATNVATDLGIANLFEFKLLRRWVIDVAIHRSRAAPWVPSWAPDTGAGGADGGLTIRAVASGRRSDAR